MKDKTRQPNVSGSFYPADPAELKDLLDGFLLQATAAETNPPIGFISPHAGYIYSGPTAAHVYNQIKKTKPQNIIIIGPSHHAYFNGISLDNMDYYQTPLGKIKINNVLIKKMSSQSDLFTYEEQAHNKEHSLEMQIPFIQITSPQSTIVPMLVGNISINDINTAALILTDIIKSNPGTIIVTSSDFSHFHPYIKAKEMDLACIEHLIAFDINQLVEGYNTRRLEMCGFIPAMVMILALKELGCVDATMLKYENSGDITGDKRSVVGYGAIAYSKSANTEGTLSLADKKYLLALARNTIKQELGLNPTISGEITSPLLSQKRGAFVTLHKNGDLRGCIGYVQAYKPIKTAIQEMAIAAAFHDPRFPALEREEEPDIEIEISLLSELQETTNYDTIKIGIHGLVIKKGSSSGLLLPQVATEWGWDRDTFLSQACLKAGLSPDAWQHGAKVYIFSAEVFNEKTI